MVITGTKGGKVSNKENLREENDYIPFLKLFFFSKKKIKKQTIKKGLFTYSQLNLLYKN